MVGGASDCRIQVGTLSARFIYERIVVVTMIYTAIDNIMKQGEEMNSTCVVVDKKEYKFKKKWDESINVNWMKESRIEINKIIDAYNYWQIEDDFNKGKALFVLTKIKYGKQIIGTQDGGDDYWDELDEMEQFVLHKIEQERS